MVEEVWSEAMPPGVVEMRAATALWAVELDP